MSSKAPLIADNTEALYLLQLPIRVVQNNLIEFARILNWITFFSSRCTFIDASLDFSPHNNVFLQRFRLEKQ